MQLKRLQLIGGYIFLFYFSFGQSIPNEKINTSGAQAYFKIVSELEKIGDIRKISWQSLFQTPPYQIMIAGQALDTSALKSNMQQTYSPAIADNSISYENKDNYHTPYKENRKKLEQYINQLNSLNVADSIKSLLFPFLPKRLQRKELFPIFYYLNYGSSEATGYGGIVLIDLFHSYKIDEYKFGLLAAHEAFHSIVSVAFQQKLKNEIDYSAPDFNLLYFLQNISEEGIADLIDKPILLQNKSPLFQKLKQLTTNDDSLSNLLIKRLDSVLTLANRSTQVIEQYNSFTDLANTFGQNGGHIPGRFMGNIIKEASLLSLHINEIEDPVSFLQIYNQAAKLHSKNPPSFSNETIEYLSKLKNKYWQE